METLPTCLRLPGELQPWLICFQSNGLSEFALWALHDDQKAIAIFSNQAKAESYRGLYLGVPWQTVLLPEHRLVQVLIQAFQSNIGYAVLDPEKDRVETLFALRDVLKMLRERLRLNAVD